MDDSAGGYVAEDDADAVGQVANDSNVDEAEEQVGAQLAEQGLLDNTDHQAHFNAIMLNLFPNKYWW